MAGCVHVARALGRARGLSYLDLIERAFDHPVVCESEHRVHRCDRRASPRKHERLCRIFRRFFLSHKATMRHAKSWLFYSFSCRYKGP
jgi:hypothetical protein